MSQERILFNSIAIKQPEKGLGYDLETTYTEDTARVQSGVLHSTPMFTVEAFSYEAKNLTVSEMSEILQIIAKGNNFRMRYFSPYYGEWREDLFYVGKKSLKIGSLKDGNEKYESLSFNIIGVNPL